MTVGEKKIRKGWNIASIVIQSIFIVLYFALRVDWYLYSIPLIFIAWSFMSMWSNE